MHSPPSMLPGLFTMRNTLLTFPVLCDSFLKAKNMAYKEEAGSSLQKWAQSGSNQPAGVSAAHPLKNSIFEQAACPSTVYCILLLNPSQLLSGSKSTVSLQSAGRGIKGCTMSPWKNKSTLPFHWKVRMHCKKGVLAQCFPWQAGRAGPKTSSAWSGMPNANTL